MVNYDIATPSKMSRTGMLGAKGLSEDGSKWVGERMIRSGLTI